MYDYLAPQGDIYRLQYESGKMLCIRTKTTIELALKWFVLCALENSCMAPEEAELDCDWTGDESYPYANCHGYDQSAINLILSPYPNSFLDDWAPPPFVWTQENSAEDETNIVCE